MKEPVGSRLVTASAADEPVARMSKVPKPAQPGSSGRHGLKRRLEHAGPVALAGGFSLITNVLVTLAVARVLTPRGYGSFIQLLGIFVVLSMPGSAIQVGVVRRVTAWDGAGTSGMVLPWVRLWHRRAGLIVVLAGLASAAVSPWVARLLSLPSWSCVIAVGCAGAAWVPLSIDRGLLQARRAYAPLAGNMILESITKALWVVALAAAGTGASGAIFGLLAAELIATLHAFGASRRTISTLPTGYSANKRASLRRNLVSDVAAALCTLGLLAWLQNFDVIILGREAPGASGQYAAISVAAKSIAYGAIALSFYLLPEAAIRRQLGGLGFKPLWIAGALLAVPAASELLVAVIMPHWAISAVFGARLAGASGSFATLVGAMILLSGTVMLSYYLLGAGHRGIVAILALGAVGATAAALVSHGRVGMTAGTDLGLQAALLLVVGIYFGAVHHEKRVLQ